MSQDLFVRWGPKKPKFEEVRCLLEDYLGKAAVIDVKSDRLFASFPEPSSNAFKRVSKISFNGREERWFEVFFHGDMIDIITREQDSFVQVVSRGFAHLCVQVWGGIADP